LEILGFFLSGGPPEAQQSESLRFYNFLFAGHGDPLFFHLCGPPEAQQSEPLRFNNCLFAGHGDSPCFQSLWTSGDATI
jgi:hypothetical protein